jgi:hypothetical protein
MVQVEAIVHHNNHPEVTGPHSNLPINPDKEEEQDHLLNRQTTGQNHLNNRIMYIQIKLVMYISRTKEETGNNAIMETGRILLLQQIRMWVICSATSKTGRGRIITIIITNDLLLLSVLLLLNVHHLSVLLHRGAEVEVEGKKWLMVNDKWLMVNG